VAAGALLLLGLFASVRVHQVRQTDAAVQLLGMDLSHSALWAAGLFVVVGVVVFVLSYGPATGIRAIDTKVHSLIDLLVETESELGKVSWPGPDELTRSTTAVLVSIVLLGAFLFVVDAVVAFLMGALRVLPG